MRPEVSLGMPFVELEVLLPLHQGGPAFLWHRQRRSKLLSRPVKPLKRIHNHVQRGQPPTLMAPKFQLLLQEQQTGSQINQSSRTSHQIWPVTWVLRRNSRHRPEYAGYRTITALHRISKSSSRLARASNKPQISESRILVQPPIAGKKS